MKCEFMGTAIETIQQSSKWKILTSLRLKMGRNHIWPSIQCFVFFHHKFFVMFWGSSEKVWKLFPDLGQPILDLISQQSSWSLIINHHVPILGAWKRKFTLSPLLYRLTPTTNSYSWKSKWNSRSKELRQLKRAKKPTGCDEEDDGKWFPVEFLIISESNDVH